LLPKLLYCFPFDIKNGKHFTEVQGGVIETGRTDQGSSNDWYTVQDFTSAANENMQLVMGCAEMPLCSLVQINTGRYTAGAMPQSTNLFSWPMNITGSPIHADQRGGHSWKYYVTTSSDILTILPQNSDGAAEFHINQSIPGSGRRQQMGRDLYNGWPPIFY